MELMPSNIGREKRKQFIEVSRKCPEMVHVELLLPPTLYSLKRVIFRMVSHDQGFSNDAHLYGGTYESSFTWFVATVVSPGGHDRVPRKVIQRNVHASTQFRRHEICWEADSEDMSIREWINAIRAGDTIRIIPKAQYPAWINFVQEAEIEAHFTKALPMGHRGVAESTAPRQVLKPNTPELHIRACYRQLDEAASEIRLLHLNPGTFDEAMSCLLVHASLQETLPTAYEALSYCWGDPRKRHDISLSVPRTERDLSEYVLSVTSNLYSALQNLRPRSGPARILWIDAICINQADLDERSSQVAMMREIYSQAGRVVLWLGDDNNSAKKSIPIINAISDRYEQLGGLTNVAAGRDSLSLTGLHDPLMEDNGVDSFIDEWPLFESPWFRRTWVVQEIFNAKTAVLHCGRNTLSWPMILQVNKCIRLSGLKMNSCYKALIPPIYERLFSSRCATGSSWSTETRILDVIVMGLELDATDPRDKIFAMLQFGMETRDLKLLPPDLVPNYHDSNSAAKVFAAFTKWWITEHQPLRILSAIQALEGRTWQATSWAASSGPRAEQPNWAWWHRGQSNWAIGILGLSDDCPYRAAADSRPDVDVIMQSREACVLRLTGVRVGTIEKVVPYPYYRPPLDHEDLHRAYVAVFDPLNLTGKWHHQLGSRTNESYVASEDPSEKRGHFNAHVDFSNRTGAVECHSNCFFSISEGQGILGLCPFSAQPGDWIVVLHGGPVPYVLRPHASSDSSCPGRYEFVGECYLQGYMLGRAIKEQKENSIPSEVFDLV